MKFTIGKLLLPGLMLCFAIVNCARQPETIVVNENPGAVAQQRDSSAAPSTSAGFKQLIIGELHRVPSLDPLFAENNSTRRTLQLLFEGVVRLNEEGEVVPAIAQSWTVSSDSLTYTFQLRNDIYFHDSAIFNSGVGRRVVAEDVKFALERMTSNSVPETAARLFMSIEGFEPYFNERHQVLNPALRRLNGVSGITLPGNNRVQIRLIEQDRHLLRKLASPYAVIYPREAVASSPGNFSGVGSGPFRLSQRNGPSGFIFSRNEDYRQQGDGRPVINRIDVLFEESEAWLLEALIRGEVHLVPELGPSLMENTLADDGTLLSDYAGSFNLLIPGGRTSYFVKHHPGSTVSLSSLRTLVGTAEPTALVGQLPGPLVSVSVTGDEAAGETTSLPEELSRPFTDNLFENMILQQLDQSWNMQGSLETSNIRVPTRNTALYTDMFVPLYAAQNMEPDDPGTVITVSIGQAVLAHNRIENLRFNEFPWWMDLRNTDLPEFDQL